MNDVPTATCLPVVDTFASDHCDPSKNMVNRRKRTNKGGQQNKGRRVTRIKGRRATRIKGGGQEKKGEQSKQRQENKEKGEVQR